ncbi:AMP-binding protein [Pseudorhodobacter aquimaris]|uniref:AMP-binding protein n=1 Tax=Pseudorhodobacter aquimaris TaxID=687412 RepID=UPI000B2DBA20|nr:AMP-binding protein [Pseudorhodobacter aquimaris]
MSVEDVGALIQLLVACDGHCEALLLLSGSLPADDVESLAQEARIDMIVSDRTDLHSARPVSEVLEMAPGQPGSSITPCKTEWIMTTSGTTGRPKMISHTLESLSRTVSRPTEGAQQNIWGLVYDPTRFAGMQVVLQSLLGGGVLVVSSPQDSMGQRLALFGNEGITHLSATPTLWRRFLMQPEISSLALRQITLGGEIADQTILDALHRQFSDARIVHIYASTELGVGFSVKDLREGFPAAWLDQAPGSIAMRITEGTLRIKAATTSAASGAEQQMAPDDDGYLDTQDTVEKIGGRVLFRGRDNGTVNIGGVKIYPETVEQILNARPEVMISHVFSKKNPFSGNILIAEVVISPGIDNEADLKTDLLRHCRDKLPKEAVPALIRVVPDIILNPAGKVRRS